MSYAWVNGIDELPGYYSWVGRSSGNLYRVPKSWLDIIDGSEIAIFTHKGINLGWITREWVTGICSLKPGLAIEEVIDAYQTLELLR